MDVNRKDVLEEVYTNVTQAAIDNGMLQDALLLRDPDSIYIVEAAAPQIRPETYHKHRRDPFHRELINGDCGRRLLMQMLRKEMDEMIER